jgi:integrase/recombinase XerC
MDTIGGDLSVSEITVRTVRSFMTFLFKSGQCGASVHRKVAAIKSLFHWIDEEGISHDVRILTVRSPKLEKHLPDVPSEKEMERLCVGELKTACPARDRVIPELLYGSGLRVSELVAINLSDFRRTDTLLVRGKGRKERMVPVTEPAQAAIAAWLPVRERILINSDLQTDALLIQVRLKNADVDVAVRQAFARSTPPTQGELAKQLGVNQSWISVLRKRATEGGYKRCQKPPERLDVRSAHRIVKRIAKSKGLPEYHPHLLRHSCGTHLHDNGVPILAISRLLGHSRLETTEIYTRVSTGRMMEVFLKAHPHARKIA